ncbi:unnamed protein product [Schistocephalus solidus]|uniref:SUZ domain-containing protein n=1 Tax=Schistocephalus solidus TaxID=70667 RepID=A0A183SC03_SCHSO|nr:unnamed protein product [Schistocephalus solidus]
MSNLCMLQKFYREFFQLLASYAIPNVPQCKRPAGDDSDKPVTCTQMRPAQSITSAAKLRDEKIRQYKEKQDLEKRIFSPGALDAVGVDEEVQSISMHDGSTDLAIVQWAWYTSTSSSFLFTPHTSYLVSSLAHPY